MTRTLAWDDEEPSPRRGANGGRRMAGDTWKHPEASRSQPRNSAEFRSQISAHVPAPGRRARVLTAGATRPVGQHRVLTAGAT